MLKIEKRILCIDEEMRIYLSYLNPNLENLAKKHQLSMFLFHSLNP